MPNATKKYHFDEDFIYLAGKKFILEEIQMKAIQSKKNAVFYLLCSFTVAPLVGILINYVFLSSLSVPSYVAPLLSCIISLAISIIYFICANDYSHTIKLYQTYLDKHQKIDSPNKSEPINPDCELKNIQPAINANAYEASLITNELLDNITQKFIAVDVETTGLDEYNDCIVEISAVIFENLEATKTFTSLIHPDVPISPAASKINHITNKMLEDQPEEKEVMQQFSEFIGDAVEEKTVLVAHNSKFDFKFIVPAMIRSGISAEFSTLDTLSLARIYMPELESYKLEDLIKIINPDSTVSHRAEQDAVNCGLLFADIIKKIKLNRQNAINSLSEEELQYAHHIKELLSNAQLDIELLRFSNSSYFTANLLSSFVKVKFRSKRKYAIIDRSFVLPANFETADCSKVEGAKNQRLFFNDISDLYILDEYFVECAKNALGDALNYINKSPHCYNNAMRITNDMIELD